MSKIGLVKKVSTNVIEIEFEKPQKNLMINNALSAHNDSTLLLIKTLLSDKKVIAIVVYSEKNLAVNDEVINLEKTLLVPVGQHAKGQTYDIAGHTIFKSNKKEKPKMIEMDSTINITKKINIKNSILETGIKVIDFFIPILKSSKIGIFGGAGVGKTVVMKEIIFNSSKHNKDKKVSSIFIGSGERSREGLELAEELKTSNLSDLTTMYMAQMNEAPGARMLIVPYGITQAEYLRDVEKEDVLLFIDNIYRYVQAGNEVASSLGKKTSSGGYQSTLESEVAAVQDRLFATDNGSITSFQTVFLPMDDLSDPASVAIFNHLDASLVLSREQASKNILPAVDILASFSNSVHPDIIGKKHYDAILKSKEILQKYKELEDVILILGVDELDEESKIIVKKALQLQNFFTQNFFMAEQFTKESGQFVKLEDTIDSVIRIIEGKFIKQNPNIFNYIGSNLDMEIDKE